MQKPPPEEDQNRFAGIAKSLVELEERLNRRALELADREAEIEKKRHAAAQREQAANLEQVRIATRNETTSQRLNENQIVLAEMKRVLAVSQKWEERVGVLEDDRMERIGTEKSYNRLSWIFGIVISSLVALGVWLVTQSFSNSSVAAQNTRAIQVAEARQERTDAAVTTIRNETLTLTGAVNGDRQRQDDRWDRIQDALERLEKGPRRR